MAEYPNLLAVYARVKTLPPAATPELIERPRLMARLVDGASAKLVLLQAPAGYGKTSLLLQWHARLVQSGNRVAWLTVDQRDHEPNIFMAYLVQALLEAGHPIDAQLRTLMTTESYYSWRVVATHLANSLTKLDAPLYLLVDDLQFLRESAALECLQFLIEITSAEFHFVLASREEPGIPVGRLRALGRVLELRTTDLRFIDSETANYFATRGQSHLTAPQLAAIESRAEGWIVGIKLLSMAMHWTGDDALSEATVSGEQREIADFFAEDVFSRQSAEVQAFLLRSCVLERLCPSLCDAVTGSGHSRELIDQCEAGGLFLVSLDQTRTWYRYHALFSDFLRRRLNEQHPGLADGMLVTASHWLDKAGFHTEAFEYALRGNDPIRAAEILNTQCDPMWSAGRQQAIQSLAARLPPHVQALYPRIMLAIAWRLVAQWKIDPARQLVAVCRARLAELERNIGQNAEVGNLRHRILHRESQIAHHLYQLEAVEQISRQLLEEVAGDNDPYLQASVIATLQYALREQFQLASVPRLIEQARECMENTGFSHGLVFHAALAGPSYGLAGRVQDARAVMSRGLQIAKELAGHGSTLGAVVAMPLAELEYECNDVETASSLIEEYFTPLPPVGIADQLVAGWLTHSRLIRLSGDSEGALESLQQASDFAERHSAQRLRLVTAAERVRVLLRMGRPDEAAALARRVGLARAGQAPINSHLTTADSAQALAWCRLAGTQGSVQDALAVARRWRAHVRAAEAVHAAVEWGVLLTELLILGGDRRAAQRALSQAIALAAPAGFVRTFLDEGEPIALLLQQMSAGSQETIGAAASFLKNLCELSEPRAKGSRVDAQVADAPDKATIAGRLSRRELEILALAGSGMLNKRISERLGLTEGTVKWYLQQIFDKLGVRDRGRAAWRARQLGLIA